MSEIKELPLKDRAVIEILCPVSWDEMRGDNCVRFCGHCSLNVYNIADMTDKEAESVLAKGRNGERICARLYRRPDGTVMTDNCPRGLRKIRNVSRWMHAKIVACFGLLLSLAIPAAQSEEQCASNAGEKDKQKAADKTSEKTTEKTSGAPKPNKPRPTMGAVRMPMPAPTPAVEMGEIAPPSGVAPDTTKSDDKKVDAKKKAHPDAGMVMGRIKMVPADKKPVSVKEEKAK
jgi:hypothetical protein